MFLRLTLPKLRSPKKPKSKRLHDPGISTHLPTSTSSSSNAAAGIQEGTRDAPIALTSDGEEERDEDGAVGRKRKRYITIVEGGKKRKIIDVVGVLHCS
jgi:hypothetical protein